MFLNEGVVLSDEVYKLAMAGTDIRLLALAFPHAADVDHIERTVDEDGHVRLWTVFVPGSPNGRLVTKAPLNPPIHWGNALLIHEPWRASNESSVVCGATSVRIELKQSGAFVSVNPLGEEGFKVYWRSSTDFDGWHSPALMPRSAAQRSLYIAEVKPIALHELRDDDLIDTACILPFVNKAVLVAPSLTSLRATWEMGMSRFNAAQHGWNANPFVWVFDTKPRTIETL